MRRVKILLKELISLCGPHQQITVRDSSKLDLLFEGPRNKIVDEKLLSRQAKLITPVCQKNMKSWKFEVIVY